MFKTFELPSKSIIFFQDICLMKFQFSLYLVSIVLVHDNFSHVIIAVKARAIHDEKEYTLLILSSAIICNMIFSCTEI